MSIKTKVMTILAVIMGIAGLAGIMVLGQLYLQKPALQAMTHQVKRVNSIGVPLFNAVNSVKTDVIQVQQWLTDVSATRGLDGMDDGWTEAERYARAFSDDVAEARRLAKLLGEDEMVKALNQAEVAFGPFYETGKEMARAYVDNGPSAGNIMMGTFDGVAATMGETMEHLNTLTADRIARELAILASDADVVRADGDTLIMLVLTLTGIGGVVGMGGGLWLVRLINSSILDLEADIATVQAKDSTPLRLSGGRTDEFGKIGQALEAFRHDILRVAEAETNQKRYETELEEARHTLLRDIADTLESSVQSVVEGISAATTQMHATAGAMSQTAELTSEQAHVVAGAAAEADSSVQTAAAAAEKLAASIDEISRRVSDSSAISIEAVSKAQATEKTISALAISAERIGEVIGIITDIAAQTNLLALNATIEAARAGDAGKGFAVVANEVKNLAGQTARATEDISAQVGAIQADTRRAVEAIEEISGTIQSLNEIASAIAGAVEEQGAATREIARNVQDASNGTRKVTANIDEVGQAADQTGHAAAQVFDAVGELARQAENLRSRVDESVSRIRTS